MEHFRFMKRINKNYNEQGYIYFLSKKYNELPLMQQVDIDEHCENVGGAYAEALKKYVTTDISATAVCIKHCMSESTLSRLIKRYYDEFPEKLSAYLCPGNPNVMISL